MMRYEESCGGSVTPFSDEMGSGSDQLFFISSYTDFDRLAHGPRGTEAKHSVYVYRFHPSDGSLVLLHMTDTKDTAAVVNPAFSRLHPRLNVVYTCTEDCENNGQIFAYAIEKNGMLQKIGQADAGGTSTCYLTIDRAQKNLIATNYWNSTLTVIPLDLETGAFTGPIKSVYDPKGGKEMKASAKRAGGVNHSLNDDSTIAERQADPHSHALVLDPYYGCIAYVPDLGKDLIRELLYDPSHGELKVEVNKLPSGLATGKADGPRYVEFHPLFNTAYVVNELSSTIAVFSVDRDRLKEISDAVKAGESTERFMGSSTLTLIQSISTVPEAFPTVMNTCGRVAVHPSGRFVIVSNRGHESITIFRVIQSGPQCGKLRQVGFFHTRGETPRHFQFDNSGQYLIVANQDSDCISVFSFNLCTGEIKYTGNMYHIPSPNFVCCCPFRDDGVAMSNPQDRSPLHTLNAAAAKTLQIGLANHFQRGVSALTDNDFVHGDGKVSPLSVHSPEEKAQDTEKINQELLAAKEEIRMLKEQLALLGR